jgi:hypothetical protein
VCTSHYENQASGIQEKKERNKEKQHEERKQEASRRKIDSKKILAWSHEQIGKVYTWENVEAAVIEVFDFAHEMLPDGTPQRPKDLCLLKQWEASGWDAADCVAGVRDSLLGGLSNGKADGASFTGSWSSRWA